MSLIGRKVLISMGGTFEPIDMVRGITNKSSGKMGLELAKQAYIRGADLTLIVANVSVEIPSIFNVIKVESTQDMFDALDKNVPNFDIFISTAAISDFALDKISNYKISSDNSLNLKFKPTVKFIRKIKKLNPNIFLVGFKAEYNLTEEEFICVAKKQIKLAKSDLVVCNDVGRDKCNFGSDFNEVLLIDGDIFKINLSSKKVVAKIIWDKIIEKIN